jgi:predicted Zn-dependent protease
MTDEPFHGDFFDGKTPLTHRVAVGIDGADLTLRGDGVDERWPLKQIEVDDSPGQGEMFVSVQGDYDARLTVKNVPADLAAALAEAAPHAFDKGAVWRRRAGFVALLAASGAAMIAIAFFGVPRLAGPLAKMTPPALETRIGDIAVRRMRDFIGDPVPDQSAKAAVQTVVNRLRREAHPPFPITALLTRADISNAFALPGGRVVVTCALVNELDRPAELQAVLAHEIAHVTERHVMAGVIRALGAQASLALMLGGAGGGQELMRAADQAAQMSFTRADEAEADRLGLSYLDAAGLDASGLATFFERHAKEEGESDKNLAAFFRTHPAGAARAAANRRDQLGPEAQALNPAQWAHLKAVCAS